MMLQLMKRFRFAATPAMAILIALFAFSPVAAQDATPSYSEGCDAMMMDAHDDDAMHDDDDDHAMHDEDDAMHDDDDHMHDDDAAMDMDVEFDQLYIDMMLPHHGSVVALSQVALVELTDPGLIAIAENIIETQEAEQEELEQYREEFYGSAEPEPMEHEMMELMMEAMPEMSDDMDEMHLLMDADALVAEFCDADDLDLAFIDLTIPHHQMAIDGSEPAQTEAVNPEIAEFAERVIADQQAEIDELEEIRVELTGEASPDATPGT